MLKQVMPAVVVLDTGTQNVDILDVRSVQLGIYSLHTEVVPLE